MEERLQKLISRAGIASRRRAEELIVAGEVTVNGQRVTELGSKADPSKDVIVVRGRKLDSRPPEPLYFALYKPRGCVTTTDDPEGRPTVMDLLGRYRDKVYPVGRLDYHSEGLLLLTNDGDWANHILSAKSKIPKKYSVKVNGMLAGSQLEKFRKGIYLDDGRRTAPALIRMARVGPNPWYEITLTEGRNRQIRRMFQALGFQVEKIKRTEIGPLELGKMTVGEVRMLSPREVHWMLHPEDAPPKTTASRRSARGPREQRDARPMVRKTAAERIAAGEKLILRVHDQEEPPERRVTGPKLASKSASRTFGRGPARPPLRRPVGDVASGPGERGERRPAGRPVVGARGLRAAARGAGRSIGRALSGSRTARGSARGPVRLPLRRAAAPAAAQPSTAAAVRPPVRATPPENRVERKPLSRIVVGPKSIRPSAASGERRPSAGIVVGPKSNRPSGDRPPQRRSDDRGPSRPSDRGGFRPSDRGPSRPSDRGGFRPADRGPSRPSDRGGFRPGDREERRPAGGIVVGPKSTGPAGDRPPQRRSDDRGPSRPSDRGGFAPPTVPLHALAIAKSAGRPEASSSAPSHPGPAATAPAGPATP